MRTWALLGILVVSILAASPALATPERRVAVDLLWMVDNAEDAQQLQLFKERLTARLSQEGFSVVSVERAPDVVLRLSFSDPGWIVRATFATETLTRVVPACGIRSAEDQLEIVQKATELVRRAHFRLLEAGRDTAPVPPPAPPAPPAPVVPPAVASSPSPPAQAASQHLVVAAAIPSPAPASAWAPEISPGLDLLIRGLHVDPLVRVGGRLRLGPRVGALLTTGVSGAGAGAITVVEGQVLAGFGYRDSLGERLRIEAAVEGGLLLHHYSTKLDSGDRFDPLLVVAFTGGLALSRRIGLELRLAPGVARTEYAQLIGNDVAWSRSRFRLEAGIGMVVR
jgi:hypothetical protein